MQLVESVVRQVPRSPFLGNFLFADQPGV